MTRAASFPLTLHLASPEHTARLAAVVAPLLGAGDVLLLSGPVGAGKSHFARALIRWRMERAGSVEDVPSPTFTLIQTYPLPDGEIWHADLYRLSSADEVEELGLSAAFEDAICLVEWPDRLPEPPAGALWLEFSNAEEPNARSLVVNGPEHWSQRLAEPLEAAA
ncbi:tRNA (adenosine(37)-N6)-threonylcarbamoyltransferase complex ATPase subunit type 1 TsaE [Vannielia litorea]|uniref:tRNA (adenosine(37)-N6)-threonylcarbamoyltransferase complex ATPase subunit type 1 TsaE n=1 Tax=Vannielia litorea TaxID=1217970 RepID=UPI001C97F145|nr:tRNA (adenosine(37)-N6)-threonylcarbamoyltransferase complex ATPase subunit type 1 TsaE [Vannielia litorea]MBY6049325.1 tRNA (adenosine(37)-N6)-threonylcarbamoyltransferase complex ATPase subunit type 1 TsaE [Vannielia litorea]MBY6076739.1 tRNA (adenosine(37)-N6)-threonylcarbamoyltransferase complex ATPase subunit type 1 TsaE [Vannielia litorea]